MTDTCSWRLLLLVCLHPSVPVLFLVLQGQLWGHLGIVGRKMLHPPSSGCSWPPQELAEGWIPPELS